MHALVFGKAQMAAHTLLARAGGVFMWPGIALTERRGAASVPIAADVARFWISRLHGPEAIDSAFLRCLATAAQKLSEGDEAGAQQALDASGLTPLSSDGAVLMHTVACSLGIGPLDLPILWRNSHKREIPDLPGVRLVKPWLECYRYAVIARMRDEHGGPYRQTVNSRETKDFGGDKRHLGRPLRGVPDLRKYSMAYCGSSRSYNNVGAGRRISARRTGLPTCNVDFSLWLYEAFQRYHAWCSSERKTTRRGNPACRGGKAIEPCQRRKGTFSRAERCPWRHLVAQPWNRITRVAT
jgi:hypothetical protein